MATNKSSSPRIDPRSPEPVYRQLTRLLAQEILSGRLAPGTKLIERQLSDQYHVARPTLHSALQMLAAQGLVHCGARRRAIVADVSSGEPRFSTARTILVREGLPASNGYPPEPIGWYSGIYGGIEATAQDMGYCVKKETFQDPVCIPLSSYVPPRSSEVAGVILYGTYDERYIGMFRTERVPLVVADYWTRDSQIDCVAVDVEAEAYAIVDFLVQRGHTSLGFVAVGRMSPTNRSREYDPDIFRMLGSLRQAAQGRPLEIRDQWVLLAPTREHLDQALPGYLAAQPRPTALLSFQGEATVALEVSAARLSLRCPEDFSLLARGPESFEGKPMTHLLNNPHLLGSAAMRLLAERMLGLRTHTVKLVLPSQLVIGSSTGPAPRGA